MITDFLGPVADEYFCTTENPCGNNEGDCDSHLECQDGLECGSKNCPGFLGFVFQVDCCFLIGECIYPSYLGDYYCDDDTNNEVCGWDGGDCCGNNVNTFCMCMYYSLNY